MFLTIPNLASNTVRKREPWNFAPSAPTSDVEKYKEWTRKGDSSHLLYSLVEGMNPQARVGKANAAAVLHGIVADYDTAKGLRKFSEEEIESGLNILDADRKPAWRHRTISGGVRLIWWFEHPIGTPNSDFTKKFYELAADELLLDTILPGLDRKCLSSVGQYYDVGTEWKAVGGRTPASFVNELIPKVIARVDWSREGVVIPIEERAKELIARWGDRWTGEFFVGARGVRFWDPTADNPTGCQVMERGFACYTGPKAWVSDTEVFGPGFVRKFNEGRVVGACEGIWAESSKFWVKDAHEMWADYAIDAIRRKLRLRGLTDEIPKGANVSEVDTALDYIQTHRRVAGAAPMLYRKDDVVRNPDGTKIINLSSVQAMEPSDETGQVWGAAGRFPWLSEFFDSWLEDGQREDLLTWLWYFYRGAYNGRPTRGHAIFLAGPASAAKSFFVKRILEPIAGGSCSAEKFVMGETEFNREVSGSPIWILDDASLGATDSARQKFHGKLKSLVANPTVVYRSMYKDGVSIEYCSRIVCCINDDPISLNLLPPMEGTIEDKIRCYKVKRPTVVFSQDFEENHSRVMSELPYFLRWLLDWEPPKEILGGRWGLRDGEGTHGVHPDLRHRGAEADGTIDFLDIVRDVMDLDWETTEWSGKSAALAAALGDTPRVQSIVRTYTPRRIGQLLGRLAGLHGSGVTIERETTTGSETKVWKIELGRPLTSLEKEKKK